MFFEVIGVIVVILLVGVIWYAHNTHKTLKAAVGALQAKAEAKSTEVPAVKP